MDVPLAVGIGLIASFVQSLGLTLQRRSHVQNEKLPEAQRRAEWCRPLWVAGFVIFLSANIGGTIFQIGSLSVVILAPLGAVSLLYNALLARVMLDAIFSWHMLTGTCLIALGAVMIGYFGTVPHAPRTLHELVKLYKRPPFVVLATMYVLVFATMLTMAHLTEWQLTIQPSMPPFMRSMSRRRPRFGIRRYLPVPTLATVAEVSENNSGISTPHTHHSPSDSRIDRLLSGDIRSVKHMHGTLPPNPIGSRKTSCPNYGTISRQQESEAPLLHSPSAEPTILALAVVYSSASGTLSGVCLLIAKSGVDLLILSLQGRNQFGSWFSWFLVAVLSTAALLQLWYLHKSLKLADPVLIAPLAFCFYNISSIMLGLVYFDDLSHLSWGSVLMVMVGTFVLLTGVWIISLHNKAEPDEAQSATISTSPLAHPSSPLTEHDSDMLSPPSSSASTAPPALPYSGPRLPSTLQRRKYSSSSLSFSHTLQGGTESAHDPRMEHRASWLALLAERGLSIGLSPSSPGFHVQPSHHLRSGHAQPDLEEGAHHNTSSSS